MSKHCYFRVFNVQALLFYYRHLMPYKTTCSLMIVYEPTVFVYSSEILSF